MQNCIAKWAAHNTSKQQLEIFDSLVAHGESTLDFNWFLYTNLEVGEPMDFSWFLCNKNIEVYVPEILTIHYYKNQCVHKCINEIYVKSLTL